MKTCTRCGTEKTVKEFHKDPSKNDGLCSQCAECKKELSRIWKTNNLEKCRLNNRKARKKYKQNNREKFNAYNRDYMQRNKEKRESSRIQRTYGLSPDDFNKRLLDQDGVCAICQQECTRFGRLSVDHDHKTGEVRGLLCNNCNKGLGIFKDEIKRFERAIKYLDGSLFS